MYVHPRSVDHMNTTTSEDRDFYDTLHDLIPTDIDYDDPREPF